MIEVFDFDGTLVDLWLRYYKAFCSAAEDSTTSFDAYKFAKRVYRRDDDVALHLGINLPDDYYDKKKELLEDIRYLKLDKPLIDPATFSLYFNERRAVILSKRRFPDRLLEEIKSLGFTLEDNRIFIIKPEEGSKANWLIKHFGTDEHINLIGDGREEVEASKKLDNMNFYFVNTGLLNNETINFFEENASNIFPISDIKDYMEIFSAE